MGTQQLAACSLPKWPNKVSSLIFLWLVISSSTSFFLGAGGDIQGIPYSLVAHQSAFKTIQQLQLMQRAKTNRIPGLSLIGFHRAFVLEVHLFPFPFELKVSKSKKPIFLVFDLLIMRWFHVKIQQTKIAVTKIQLSLQRRNSV